MLGKKCFQCFCFILFYDDSSTNDYDLSIPINNNSNNNNKK